MYNCIDIGEQKFIKFNLKYNKNNNIFNYKIYYQDLLSNWYMQEVEMVYSNNKPINKLSISKEKILKNLPNINT